MGVSGLLPIQNTLANPYGSKLVFGACEIRLIVKVGEEYEYLNICNLGDFFACASSACMVGECLNVVSPKATKPKPKNQIPKPLTGMVFLLLRNFLEVHGTQSLLIAWSRKRK